MSKNISRRDFNKVVAAGAALGVFGDSQTAVSAAEKSASLSSVSPRWLPNDETVLRKWREITREAIRKKRGERLHPVIRKFQKLIDDDPVVRMTMTQMIQQIPGKYREHHPRNLQGFLLQLNAVLTVAPHYMLRRACISVRRQARDRTQRTRITRKVISPMSKPGRSSLSRQTMRPSVLCA